MSVPFRVSLVFLLCAFGFFGAAFYFYHRYDWTPVNTPIAFDTARTYTATFRADSTARYYVGVDCDRTDDRKETEKQLRSCVTRCVVTDAHGNIVSKPIEGNHGGQRPFYGFACAWATDRQTYAATFDVGSPNADLNRLNPHLVIELDPRDYEGFVIGMQLLIMAGLFCTAVSFLALLIGVIWFRGG